MMVAIQSSSATASDGNLLSINPNLATHYHRACDTQTAAASRSGESLTINDDHRTRRHPPRRVRVHRRSRPNSNHNSMDPSSYLVWRNTAPFLQRTRENQAHIVNLTQPLEGSPQQALTRSRSSSFPHLVNGISSYDISRCVWILDPEFEEVDDSEDVGAVTHLPYEIEEGVD